jgi:dipeptidase
MMNNMTRPCLFVFLSLLLMAFLLNVPVQACMTFVVTPGASADGSMYVGHIEDGYGESLIGSNISESNIYLLYVPPADHPPGSQRTIRYDPYAEWTVPLTMPTNLTASIDQVNHTYGYLTTNYGAENEYQLMSGEAGRASKVWPEWDPEKRIMSTSELSNIAMERCKTAHDAVILVGSLVDKYGFYGSGEILTFADPKEAWVMEFAGGTPDGTGGLWVAEKIKDGEVFSSANEYRIREVIPNDSGMLYSPRLFESAEADGWWNPADGPLDWAATVGTGEYLHPYYSTARVWSMYNRIAPSLNLSLYVPPGPADPYPFSVKPDKPLDTADVFSLVRDHYEGTPFDLTKGIAAGPFGDPYRITGPYEYGDIVQPGVIAGGAWQRPVSTLYSPYTYIAQGNSTLPYPVGGVLWFGFGPSYETAFMPVYAGVTGLPSSFTTGDRTVYSHDSAWWPFNLVANLETIRYDRMSVDIREEQRQVEGAELASQNEIETTALHILATNGESVAKDYLTNYTKTNAGSVIDRRWNLLATLYATYLNGDMYEDGLPNETGYPAWWLDTAGYQYGPRVYPLKELQQITNLPYENQTLTVRPGDELAALSAQAEPPQAGEPQRTYVIAASAHQVNSTSVIVTYNGGQDAQYLQSIEWYVGGANVGVMSAGNGQISLPVGTSATYPATAPFNNPVIGIGHFTNGSTQVIFDDTLGSVKLPSATGV